MEKPLNAPPEQPTEGGDEKPTLLQRAVDFVKEHPFEIAMTSIALYLATRKRNHNNPNVNKTVVKFN